MFKQIFWFCFLVVQVSLNDFNKCRHSDQNNLYEYLSVCFEQSQEHNWFPAVSTLGIYILAGVEQSMVFALTLTSLKSHV